MFHTRLVAHNRTQSLDLPYNDLVRLFFRVTLRILPQDVTVTSDVFIIQIYHEGLAIQSTPAFRPQSGCHAYG